MTKAQAAKKAASKSHAEGLRELRRREEHKAERDVCIPVCEEDLESLGGSLILGKSCTYEIHFLPLSLILWLCSSRLGCGLFLKRQSLLLQRQFLLQICFVCFCHKFSSFVDFTLVFDTWTFLGACTQLCNFCYPLFFFNSSFWGCLCL